MAGAVEHPLNALRDFLPDGAFDAVVESIQRHRIHLTVTRARRTVLGDYRHPVPGKNHRITVNGNLNKFEFLITWLHELAHLMAFEQYGPRIEVHGGEWKRVYSQLLQEFLSLKIFPPELASVLRRMAANPAATANGETELLRVLRSYDPLPEGHVMVEKLPLGAKFISGRRLFIKGARRRKRFECREEATGLLYLFGPLTVVRVA